MSATVGIESISQIAINVHDVERAEAFYRDVLGLEHLFTVPNMAFFKCGGIRLMLGIASEEQYDHPSSILYYDVADIHSSAAALSARGVSFESEPHCVHKAEGIELWMAFLRDPEGNVLAITTDLATKKNS